MSKKLEDSHLNLFFSYSQGGFETLEEEKILEDNVTRAFIITLKNLDLKVLEIILNKIVCRDYPLTEKPYFALQKSIDNLPSEIWNDGTARERFVLCIAPKAERPREINKDQLEIIELFSQHVASIEEDKKRTFLQDQFNKLIKKISREKFSNKEKAKIESILIKEFADFHSIDFSIINYDTFYYLNDLLYGSRPDAWIITNKLIILVEIKINGEINATQIDRHINKNFRKKKDTRQKISNFLLLREIESLKKDFEYDVLKVLLSWRSDIYPIIDRLADDEVIVNEKSRFLLKQFLDFLEMNNMGKLEINQADFIAIRNPEMHIDHLRNFKEKLYQIADHAFNRDGKKFYLESQSIDKKKNYIGIHIGEYAQIKYHIHITFGFNGRGFKVHLTIQMKNVIMSIIKRRSEILDFDEQFSTLLANLKPLNDIFFPFIDVYDRWFLKPEDNYYFHEIPYMLRSFEHQELLNIIKLVFKRFDELSYRSRKQIEQEKLNDFVEDFNLNTVIGVIDIGYFFKEPYLINMGEKINDLITQAIVNLKPLYDFFDKIIENK